MLQWVGRNYSLVSRLGFPRVFMVLECIKLGKDKRNLVLRTLRAVLGKTKRTSSGRLFYSKGFFLLERQSMSSSWKSKCFPKLGINIETFQFWLFYVEKNLIYLLKDLIILYDIYMYESRVLDFHKFSSTKRKSYPHLTLWQPHSNGESTQNKAPTLLLVYWCKIK